MTTLWTTLVSIAAGILLLWLVLVAALWHSRPDDLTIKDSLRLLPDLLRLLKRLASDHEVPLGARIRLWLLLAYLASPIDLVPDFIPVIGYADDAVIVALGLRSVTRRAGAEVLDRHWPGTPEGLVALRRLARLDSLPQRQDQPHDPQ